MTDVHRAGFVAVCGRPNTGKSTLVNALVGEVVSVATAKAQTTRHSILGIRSEVNRQIVFVDTPGLHDGNRKLINRAMNRSAVASIAGADLALMVVEATRWQAGDGAALERISGGGAPVLLAVNKIDRVKPRSRLLPILDDLHARGDFAEVIPIAALTGDNLERLVGVIADYLPESPALFESGITTDRHESFRFGEIIRGRLMELLSAEVPYGAAVEIVLVERHDGVAMIDAIIWVEKESHKGIVVGRGGERLKQIASRARIDLERLFEEHFYLQVKVKVKQNWSDNAHALRQLGFEEPK